MNECSRSLRSERWYSYNVLVLTSHTLLVLLSSSNWYSYSPSAGSKILLFMAATVAAIIGVVAVVNYLKTSNTTDSREETAKNSSSEMVFWFWLNINTNFVYIGLLHTTFQEDTWIELCTTNFNSLCSICHVYVFCCTNVVLHYFWNVLLNHFCTWWKLTWMSFT